MKNPFTTIFIASAAVLVAAVSVTLLWRNGENPSPFALEQKEKAAKSSPPKAGDRRLPDPVPVTLRKIPEREGVLVAGQADSRSFGASKVFQSEVLSQDQIKSQMEKLRARPRTTDSPAQR